MKVKDEYELNRLRQREKRLVILCRRVIKMEKQLYISIERLCSELNITCSGKVE